MKINVQLSIVAIVATLTTTVICASEGAPKEALVGSYQLIYSVLDSATKTQKKWIPIL